MTTVNYLYSQKQNHYLSTSFLQYDMWRFSKCPSAKRDRNLVAVTSALVKRSEPDVQLCRNILKPFGKTNCSLLLSYQPGVPALCGSAFNLRYVATSMFFNCSYHAVRSSDDKRRKTATVMPHYVRFFLCRRLVALCVITTKLTRISTPTNSARFITYTEMLSLNTVYPNLNIVCHSRGGQLVATCCSPQRFQWPAEAFRKYVQTWNFLQLITVMLVLRLTWTETCFCFH